MRRITVTLAVAFAVATSAEPPLWTSAHIAEVAHALLAKAVANPAGVAIESLVATPGHQAIVVARLHTGEAEQHDLWTDEIELREGEADLLTGGTMTERRATGAPGEFRGRELTGATARRMHPGDVAEVPAGTPHMMRVLLGGPVVTLSWKVK